MGGAWQKNKVNQFCYRMGVTMFVKVFFVALMVDQSLCQELPDIYALENQTVNFTAKYLLLQENMITSVNFPRLCLCLLVYKR